MIQKIKEKLFQTYDPGEKKGLFLSGFDGHRHFLGSGGTINDMTLSDLVSIVYDRIFQDTHQKVFYVACDVVYEKLEIHDVQKSLSLSPIDFGFFIKDKEDDRCAVMLPNVVGIENARDAFYAMKKKYGIHGQVDIIAFKTERIVIAR